MNRSHLLLLLLISVALRSTVVAHQLDECVQATLIAIEPRDIRLRYQITPGLEVAARVLALIDADRDDLISTNEVQAYGERVGRELTVRLDQRSCHLKVDQMIMPSPAELRSGSGMIQIEFLIAQPSHASGAHQLTFENLHRPAASVFLVNAALPRSELIRIDSQTRNHDQSVAAIDFTVRAPPRSFTAILVTGFAALVVAVLAAIMHGRLRFR